MVILDFFKEVGISGLFDIVVMSVLLYSILVWMKRTRRAASVITGIIIVAVVFLLARQFNLLLTAAILQGFFAVILIALIVIFQEELRYFFEKVTHWSLSQPLSIKKQKAIPRHYQTTDTLVRTLMDLAGEKIGALLVIRAGDSIHRHLEGGETLNGVISEKILKSIFDPHSVGHDGAVVIEGETIRSFSCHLPLSKNHEALKEAGTRHAAALGLSELTDALCIAVSEERGKVSVARHGRIDVVDEAGELSRVLNSFFLEKSGNQTSPRWRDFFKRNYREKTLGAGLAVALWFVLVYGAETIYKTFDVPVQTAEFSTGLVITQTDPKEIAVTLSGQRKLFYLTDKDEVKVILKPWQLQRGTTTITLLNSNFSTPEGLTYESAEPQVITVTVESSENAESRK